MPDPALESESPSSVTPLVLAMADYAATFSIDRAAALASARRCLIGALRRGFEALRDPQRAALIGPIVPGALMPGGARVPGTSLELEPAQAAFCIALMLAPASDDHRLAATGERIAHPLAALLAAADYQARKAIMEGKPPPKVRDLLAAMLKAVQIQGTLAALEEQDETQPVPLRRMRAAVSAVVAASLGGTAGQIARAISYACIDGEMLVNRRARHAGGRADLATADAVARAVRHACQATAPGRPGFLSAEDLELVQLASGVLGASPATARKPFGTVGIDWLAGAGEPRELTEITAGLHAALDAHFPARQAVRVKALLATPERLDELPVSELMAALVANGAR